MVVDSPARTLAKTVTWRAAALGGTIAVVWAWTGKPTLAFAVGSAEALGKMLLYYLHERGWAHIPFGQRAITPKVIWITGLSGSGKSSLAKALQARLQSRRKRVEHLDGERVRQLFPLAGFGAEERRNHTHRVGLLASILEQNGTFVVASLVSPQADARSFVRSLCRQFVEVHVSTPLAVCEARDTTGLYARARAGELANVAGLDLPYEEPRAPDVRVDLSVMSIETAADAVLSALAKGPTKRATESAAVAPFQPPKGAPGAAEDAC